MAQWILKSFRKSFVQTTEWINFQGQPGRITVSEVYREGEYAITTSDDEIPEIDMSQGSINADDLVGNGNIEEVEFLSSYDQVDSDLEFDGVDEATEEAARDAYYDGSFYDWAGENNWGEDETAYIYEMGAALYDETGEKYLGDYTPQGFKPAESGTDLDRMSQLAGIPKTPAAPALTAIPGFPKASKNLIALVNQVPADRRQAALADIQKVAKMGATEAQIIASLKKDYLK